MLHVSDVMKHELARVMIRIVVTDDAVITVSLFRDRGRRTMGCGLEGKKLLINIYQ